MNEVLTSSPLTAFDAVAIILILISALMAFARGLIREMASLIAFAAGLAAAYYAWVLFGAWARALLPAGWHDWIADAALVVVAFLTVYILAAWFGARFSRLVHASTDIGTLDRLAGMAFGAARGAIVVVGFVIFLDMAVPPEALPKWISGARTFPLFEQGAQWVRTEVPGIAKRVSETLPETEPSTDQ